MTHTLHSGSQLGWRKSSYSNGAGQNCVEVADLTTTPHPAVALRDSKNPHGPTLLLPPNSFAAFLDHLHSVTYGA